MSNDSTLVNPDISAGRKCTMLLFALKVTNLFNPKPTLLGMTSTRFQEKSNNVKFEHSPRRNGNAFNLLTDRSNVCKLVKLPNDSGSPSNWL